MQEQEVMPYDANAGRDRRGLQLPGAAPAEAQDASHCLQPQESSPNLGSLLKASPARLNVCS